MYINEQRWQHEQMYINEQRSYIDEQHWYITYLKRWPMMLAWTDVVGVVSLRISIPKNGLICRACCGLFPWWRPWWDRPCCCCGWRNRAAWRWVWEPVLRFCGRLRCCLLWGRAGRSHRRCSRPVCGCRGSCGWLVTLSRLVLIFVFHGAAAVRLSLVAVAVLASPATSSGGCCSGHWLACQSGHGIEFSILDESTDPQPWCPDDDPDSADSWSWSPDDEPEPPDSWSWLPLTMNLVRLFPDRGFLTMNLNRDIPDRWSTVWLPSITSTARFLIATSSNDDLGPVFSWSWSMVCLPSIASLLGASGSCLYCAMLKDVGGSEVCTELI